MGNSRLSKRIVSSVLTAIAVGSFQGFLAAEAANPSANTQQEMTPGSLQRQGDFQLAQLTGTCRSVNRSVLVYRTAAATDPIRSIAQGTVVRLAANTGTNGFIAIDSPLAGFVQTRFLSPAVPCGPTNPPPANRCRRVAKPPEGLVIRSQPNSGATILGGVGVGETVNLTTVPPTVKQEALGGGSYRAWVEISLTNTTAVGYVSNGTRPAGTSNLVLCQ